MGQANIEGLSVCAGNARLAGDYKEALQLGREALKQFRQNGDKGGIAATLAELSLLAVDLGRYEEALTYARATISVTQEFNSIHDPILGIVKVCRLQHLI